ncbi:MAG: TRAP transporter substrate-binding protein [Caldisericia bacterium]|nr:TRAP transporter substrate-binding protein [Caldisericia bacterium]
MKNKKFMFFIFIWLILVTLFASSLAFADESKTLRIGSSTSEGTPEVIAAHKFAEVLGKISGGALEGKVLAGGLAGGERDIVEGQQLGILEMSVVSGIFQNFDPAMMILEYEFLFKNEEHIDKVFNGPVGEKIASRLIEKVGVRPLQIYMRTPRLLTTNRPIYSLEDLKGLKIRVPEMPARVALWKALGASPTPLAFPEVFTALQTGTIDGQENPIGLIYSSKFYEVVDWLALTNHVYGFMILNISEQAYQSLSVQEKEWVNVAAELSKYYNDKIVKETEKVHMEEVTKYMNVTEPDMGPWREATKDVYKQFIDIEGFEELYLDIVEAGKDL